MKYKPYKNDVWNEKEAKQLFQILPFYNFLNETPVIKKLSNVELQHELPFCDELSVVERSKAFKGYPKRYKVEILEPKDPLAQLEVGKSSIKDLFKYLLNEMKGFKYQITVATLLSKHKLNRDIEYSSVYFNSTTKAVINSDKYGFDKSFQEFLYRIHNWINEGSGWIIESMNGEYVNIFLQSIN